MNYRMILRLVCYIFRVEAVCLLPSFFISLFLGEEAAAFGQGASMALCAVLSLVTCLFPLKEREIGAREGFLGVALCWVVVSLAGGLPFFFSGAIPNFIDCFFETVSGFTTTGSSILTDVEAMPKGLLYWRSIADFDTTGGVLDLTDVASDAGNVRSTVMMDEDGFLYFTTQGGYLWCCSYKDGLTVEWHIKLGATSTSTPTKVGDRIYVGYYSGFNAGGVQCVTVSIGEDGSSYIPSVAPVASGFPVQSSIVVMGDGTGTDYLYFNTNAQKGAGYCYSYDGGTTGSKVWGTTGDTYALGGMAIDNGYAVFGNDYNHLYVVHD